MGRTPGFDNQTGEPAVHIKSGRRGATIFSRSTREESIFFGKRMAMVLVEKGKGRSRDGAVTVRRFPRADAFRSAAG